jgi:hypothetical protein
VDQVGKVTEEQTISETRQWREIKLKINIFVALGKTVQHEFICSLFKDMLPLLKTI